MSPKSSAPRCPGPCSAAPPINPLNRREFLARTGNGFGLLGLLSLLESQAGAKERTPRGRDRPTRWRRRPGISRPRPSGASSCS